MTDILVSLIAVFTAINFVLSTGILFYLFNIDHYITTQVSRRRRTRTKEGKVNDA